jgi:uncharacterized membrane protein YdjX (TVP38/TMEM64 family)
MANPAPRAEPGAAAPEPHVTPWWKRVPRRAVVRFLLLVALVLVSAAIARWTPLGRYLDRELLQTTLDGLRDVWWAPLLLIGLFLLFCPLGLPATPFLVVGGLVFGVWRGALFNFIGTFSSAMVGYGLARWLGADFFHHLFGPRLRRFEKRVARRGFWYLVGARLLPIPFPVINFGLALAGVKPGTYALTSALGLAPATMLWTWFAAALGDAAKAAPGTGGTGGLVAMLVAMIVLLVVLILAPATINARARRRRLCELRGLRSTRGHHR